MADVHSDFLFTVCQVGAEPTLKKEIARDYPSLRFAFSRPGFVTFKNLAAEKPLTPEFELNSVFARAYGISLGKRGGRAEPEGTIEDRVKWVIDSYADLREKLGGELKLHVFERDQYAPGEEPLGFVLRAWSDAAKNAIAPILKERFPAVSINSPSVNGDLVFDVMMVEPEEWWIGIHQHGRGRSAHAGGRPEITLPQEAPSRAYLKLEEGIDWSRVPIQKGDSAVEIGSAPGGASYALLKRGVQVTGIDPGKMDPVVLGNPHYRHIEKPVFYVERPELPKRVDWLLCDMNVDPKVAIKSTDRLREELQDSLLGLLLTVKLNRWDMAADIPGMIDYLSKSGMVRVRARQLANNRQEIFLYGLTRKGVGRLAK